MAFDDAAILEAARSLGVLSGSATAPRILSALCQPGASADSVGRLVGQEPGLTARVLRVANSPFYGLSRAVATVDRAVVVLGLDAVRGIAAAACLDRNFLRSSEATPGEIDALLLHSVASAAAAEAIARRCERTLAPEAFIAGLLHDLGVVAQLRLNSAGTRRFLQQAGPAADASEALEFEQVGVTHAHCSAVIFSAWNLPELLTESARHHHAVAAARPGVQRLAALVGLGHEVSTIAGLGFPLESGAGQPDPRSMALVGLEKAALEGIVAALPERVAELRQALSG